MIQSVLEQIAGVSAGVDWSMFKDALLVGAAKQIGVYSVIWLVALIRWGRKKLRDQRANVDPS